ncbi:MAG: hypothetical protein FJ104_00195 [Deltaproteobacteria bacterium]|nr:hypothetical protein [Deltaproteobacteria bacterium]
MQFQGIVQPDVGGATAALTGRTAGNAAGTCESSGTSCTFQDCGEDGSENANNGTLSCADGVVAPHRDVQDHRDARGVSKLRAPRRTSGRSGGALPRSSTT